MIANLRCRILISILTCLNFIVFTHQIGAQAKLDFSQERGFSDAPFILTITPEDPSATIRYTLDGEEPSATSGEIYNGSISVETTTVLRAIGYIIGVDTSKIYTHTYLFIDDVINQPANIQGWPNNSYDIGSGNATAVHDYEMDPDIVNSSQYNADLIQGLKDIPSMSIVLPKDDFWDVNDSDAEKKTSIELIYADDPTKNEQEDGGIEPHSHNRLKRSFRISFKNIYGAGDWDSDIFRNAAVGSETAENEFDRVVLRAGNNRAWSRNWNTDRTAFTRDEWFRQSQIAASGIGSHGTFVHLFINGLYWGLYNPVERPDESFTSTYLGGEKEDWFAVSHGGDQGGVDDRYDYMKNTLLNKDLTNSTNYDELKLYLDIDKFSDYVLLSWMTGVQDWPGNNWWGGNRNTPSGPFMFFGWDNEWSWDVTKNANNGAWVHPEFRSNDTGGQNSAFVFNKSKVNDDFMMTFADRVYKLCFNDGVMTDDNSRDRWSALNDHIENAVVAESARWGDGIDDGVTRTRDVHWQDEVDRLDDLMDGNVQRLIDALLVEGYYPTIDPPLFINNGNVIEVQEFSVSSNYNIDLDNPNGSGQIYYTTNGIDPRLSGGNIAPTAIAYSNEDIVVNNSSSLLARVKNGNEWSALHCLSLIVEQDLSWIKLTEIMYNPADFGAVDGSELEFLEIKNTSNSLSLDIGGLQITDGVEFTFPVGTIMDPQSFLVVASNAIELSNKCPGVNIFGEYEGQLSNGGENIEFLNFQEETIISVVYDDKSPWPIAADGSGHSLVSSTLDPVGSQDDSSLWVASSDNFCGSPAADDCSSNQIGQSCNDDDDNTYADVITENCICKGTIYSSFGNYIWLDENNDGIQDNTESGIEGIDVELYDVLDNFIAVSTSLNNGQYSFDQVQSGDYYVRVDLEPTTYSFSPYAQGFSSELDSNIDGSHGPGTSPIFNLNEEIESGVDIGLVFSVVDLEWSYFQGVYNLDHIALAWITESELDVDYFELERSVNNYDEFTTLTRIDAIGNSSTSQNYQYRDYDIDRSGNYFYRLKHVDLNGYAAYIKTIQININKNIKNGFDIFPNPASTSVTLDINLQNRSEVGLFITDITGNVVLENIIKSELEASTHSRVLDVSNLPSGLYYIHLNIGSEIFNKKFLVLD